jgi:hypothetical protein
MGLLSGRKKGLFTPNYNELSLAMMSLAFLLVFLFNGQLRQWVFKLASAPKDRVRTIIVLLFFTTGLVLSLYHVFTERKKTVPEKHAMLFFAVLTNGISGIYASTHILRQSEGAHSIFILLPVWNIINCIILLVSYRMRFINVSSISDEDATLGEALFGFVITVGIFAVCQFVFELYWAITFSICVIYATSFSEALGSMFHPGRQQIAAEDIAIDGKSETAEKIERCELCGRAIPRTETPWVIKRKVIVCKGCYDKIRGS